MNTSEPGGVLFDIQRWSTEDGPGIRTTLFFKGCPLRCAWCCNPESWSPRAELGVFEERCTSCRACEAACPQGIARPAREARQSCDACGSCVSVCPRDARQVLGRWWPVHEVLDSVERDQVFFRRSGGGITFSGGEATAQPAFFGELAKQFHRRGRHLVLETCGHFSWADNEAALSLMDLVFFDLKYMDEGAHRRWTGVGTALIHENAQRLARSGIPMVVRFPWMPGLNDSEENLRQLAGFVTGELRAPIEVMPYHALGRSKYHFLGRREAAGDLAAPSAEALSEIKEHIRSLGSRLME